MVKAKLLLKKEKIIQEDILDIIENYLKNLINLKLKQILF